MFYQDRLGTTIGETQKKTVLLHGKEAGAAQEALANATASADLGAMAELLDAGQAQINSSR